MTVEIGQVAPDFTLKNQHGEEITLSALRGKPVVLIFIPFASSGICTGELCEVRDRISEIDGATVVAVTCDHFFSNRAWADRDNYNFDILSDFWPHGAVAQAYGVFNSDAGAANRATYVLDAEGVVRWKVEQGIGQARQFDDYRKSVAELLDA